MNNEEMENKMEFLLKQQESVADSQREIYKMLHELAERQDKLAQQQDKLAERQDKFQGQQEETNKAVFGLVAIVGSLAQSQKAANERVAELSERLDIFINVLERYMNENRNGNRGEES